jgi:RNA polymerase sigma-70 factor, ECF subfamily
VENLGGWLTTVVSRVCLNMLNSRRSRREEPPADPPAVRAGARAEVRGERAVAETFAGRAEAARLALVDGAFGAVSARGGRPRFVFGFTVDGGKIVEIEILADRARLREMALEILEP